MAEGQQQQRRNIISSCELSCWLTNTGQWHNQTGVHPVYSTGWYDDVSVFPQHTVSSSWASHEHLSNLYTSWTQLILIPINIPAGEGWLQHGYSKVFFSDLQSPQTRNTFGTRCQCPFSNTSHMILLTGVLFNKGSKLDIFTQALCPLKAVWL